MDAMEGLFEMGTCHKLDMRTIALSVSPYHSTHLSYEVSEQDKFLNESEVPARMEAITVPVS